MVRVVVIVKWGLGLLFIYMLGLIYFVQIFCEVLT